jgi:hypothetical protein
MIAVGFYYFYCGLHSEREFSLSSLIARNDSTKGFLALGPFTCST